jgi:alkylhydroperoxidase/carboxymuconolactone decarboxylase family protein YurZ
MLPDLESSSTDDARRANIDLNRSMGTRATVELPRRLDDRTRALVRLGALVATGGEGRLYCESISDALAAGATHDDVVDVLVAVAPIVGLARVVSATTLVARGLGIDVDRTLEELE